MNRDSVKERAESEEGSSQSWVNLLSDRSMSNTSKRKGVVKVMDCSPASHRRSRVAGRPMPGIPAPLVAGRTGVQDQFTHNKMLKTQGIGLPNAAGRLQYQQDPGKVELESELIAKLMADNTRLVSQMAMLSASNGTAGTEQSFSMAEQNLQSRENTIQGLLAHICSLREEFQMLAFNYQSPSPVVAGLLEDLKRLTYKNADLCNALAATQSSRNVLEREIILLKRTHLEERSKGPLSTHFLEIKDLLMQNEKLKKMLDCQQLKNDELQAFMQSQAEKLKSYENENARQTQDLEKLRLSQLTEIDQRCREVDALKQQLSGQLNTLQQDHDNLSRQLAEQSAERESLLGKVAGLEGENKALTMELGKRRQECDNRVRAITDHAEQVQLENNTLQSQLMQLQRRQEGDLRQARSAYTQVKEQLEKSTTNMQTVLSELEAVRKSGLNSSRQLTELRAEVDRLRGQLGSCLQMNKELKCALEQRRARIEHLEKALHQQVDNSIAVMGSWSSVSSASSLVRAHDRCSSSTQAELVSVNQRLATSRQDMVHLEVQLSRLKTDNAKLSGSYQAMLSIRDSLSGDNDQIRRRAKDLKCDRDSLMREREALVARMGEMSSSTELLTSDLSALKSELYQMSELNQRMEEQLMEYRTQLSLGTGAHGQLECLQNVMESEVHKFNCLLHDFDDTLTNGNQEMSDLQERIRICGQVNCTRRGQIEVCDESTMRLQGELEVLRARKSVLLCLSEQNYSLGTTTLSATSVSMFVRPLHAQSDTLPAQPCINCFKFRRRMKQKLKLQKKQANFLRVKLGYTLTELRLYKQLKGACDQQLYQLQTCLRQVQDQYQQCTEQLESVEQYQKNTAKSETVEQFN